MRHTFLVEKIGIHFYGSCRKIVTGVYSLI